MKSSSSNSAFELAGHLQQNLEREQRLQRAECAGHGSEHARLRTIAHHAIGDRIRPEAAQAGVRRLRLVDLKLPLVLIDAGEHGGLLREHRGIVDQILGAKIIAAVDNDVMAADQFERVVRIEVSGVRFDLHGGIDGRNRGARQIRLRFADIGKRVNRLAMQIAGIQDVGVDQP